MVKHWTHDLSSGLDLKLHVGLCAGREAYLKKRRRRRREKKRKKKENSAIDFQKKGEIFYGLYQNLH